MKPYRPSTGTEGADFMDHFCGNCIHDEEYRETGFGGCKIAADSLAFNVGDPEYPKEWVIGADGPICTAFCPLSQADNFIRAELEKAGQMRLVE